MNIPRSESCLPLHNPVAADVRRLILNATMVRASLRRLPRFNCYLLLMSALISPAFSQTGPLGLFTDHTDIGAPKQAGSATYDPAVQEYVITDAGSNVWYRADQFHFVWTKWSGDFIVRARFEFIGKGAVAHRKV